MPRLRPDFRITSSINSKIGFCWRRAATDSQLLNSLEYKKKVKFLFHIMPLSEEGEIEENSKSG
jgi:hypothetical protein